MTDVIVARLAAAIAFGAAANLDNLGVGISYGVSGTRVSWVANLAIAAISAIATGLAMSAGGLFANALSVWSTTVVGALLMASVGLWVSLKAFLDSMGSGEMRSLRVPSLNVVISILREPSRADTDSSGTIDLKEAMVLGLALAVNCVAGGMAAGMLRIPIPITSGIVALFSYLTIWLGWHSGRKLGARWLGNRAGVLAGFILVALGLCRLHG